MYLSIRKAIKQNVVIIEACQFFQLCTKFYPTSCCKCELQLQRKLLGIINVDFDATGQLLIIYSAFVKYLRKKWEYNEAVRHLFIDFEKAYDSVGREIFHNILFESDNPMKLVMLIKMSE